MAKRFFIFFACFFVLIHSYAQVQSPEQFLGYKIGTRFTPHHKIVEYVKHVANASPTMVKLQQYGETNERRPLYVAFVSAASNISNLESIRQNNLRLAGMNNSTPLNNVPAIVWLSYNVHGDEASSSEAAMLTLYSLVDPSNSATKAWLQNTLVVIDPCMNPDGRDRYVNWYNTVVSQNNILELSSREHQPPWPRARTNHYYFDLNRDWAWQTQKETQQRMILYNNWLPQIHVDFHEQSYNDPYYFAPGAEPVHQLVTPWQRSFEATIGRNNAKYFDEKGWLYFTKEYFDLIYPAYGDTYPLLNGAIGMTYEQGGSGAAGLAVITNTGDTLTLTDRATHHYTTGLSTVEVAAQHSTRLLTEFQNFHNRSKNNGAGDYKAYVIKYNERDASRIATLVQMLERNKIQYGLARGGNIRGLNYANDKEESVSLGANDIVIPTTQPKGVLVTALFEPETEFKDTLTYDITAWSLPYAFGLTAYATKTEVPMTQYSVVQNAAQTSSTEPYGYVIRWNGIPAVKLTTQLLQKGIKLRMQQQPFSVNGQNFDRGSILVLKTGNQNNTELWQTVRDMAVQNGVQIYPVNTGMVEKGADFGSSKIASLGLKKVALLTGEGTFENSVGEIWHFFDQQLNYPVTLINSANFSRINLADFDVLILPNGNHRILTDKASSDGLKDWVNKGGKLIALENSVAQLSRLDWAIKTKKEDSAKDNNSPLRRYEDAERQSVSTSVPGTIFKVYLDNSHPLAFGYPDHYYTLKQDDAVYSYFENNGWNVGVLKNDNPIAGVIGSKVKDKMKNGLLFGTQNVGNGQVVYLADNVLFRSFWESGKLMFSNAVFLVGQ